MKTEEAYRIARANINRKSMSKSKKPDREVLRSAQASGVTNLDYLRACLLLRLSTNGPIPIKSWLEEGQSQ